MFTAIGTKPPSVLSKFVSSKVLTTALPIAGNLLANFKVFLYGQSSKNV